MELYRLNVSSSGLSYKLISVEAVDYKDIDTRVLGEVYRFGSGDEDIGTSKLTIIVDFSKRGVDKVNREESGWTVWFIKIHGEALNKLKMKNYITKL